MTTSTIILSSIFIIACAIAVFMWASAREEKRFLCEFHYWWNEFFGNSPMSYQEFWGLDYYHNENYSGKEAARQVGLDEKLHFIKYD